MITLRGFFLVVLTVVLRHLAEQADTSAVLDGGTAAAGIGAYCIGFCVLGKLCATVTSLQFANQPISLTWQRFEQRRANLEWLWAGALPWSYSGSGWSSWLGQLSNQGWPNAMLLVAWFLPSLITLAAMDLCATELEISLTRDLRSSRSVRLCSRWWTRLRLGATGGVLMCLAPVLFSVSAIDVIVAGWPQLSPTTHAILGFIVLAVICFAITPLWMRTWVSAEPLASEHAVVRRTTYFCQCLKIPRPSVRKVNGDGAWHGAALVGWTRFERQLWIGDSVLRSMNERELDMVLLHELAHLRRGHCWLRLAPLVVCGLAACFGTTVHWSWLCVVVVSIAIGLGWISRWCELDADREACRIACRLCIWCDQQPECAAFALIAALDQMQGSAAAREKWSWLHPSVAYRAKSMQRLALQTVAHPS